MLDTARATSRNIVRGDNGLVEGPTEDKNVRIAALSTHATTDLAAYRDERNIVACCGTTDGSSSGLRLPRLAHSTRPDDHDHRSAKLMRDAGLVDSAGKTMFTATTCGAQPPPSRATTVLART